MYKFNNDNIITGYIKQLLHSFNLPKIKVFNNEQEFKKYYPDGCNGFGIIKDYKNKKDAIVYLNNGEIQFKCYYVYGSKYKNITSNLSLFNGLYDTTCHEYLGDYLRFIRDYYDINLMSLYNCFANEILLSDQYKYIVIPVKHNTDYTIAFDGTKYSYTFTYKNTISDIEKIFENKIPDGYDRVVTNSSTFKKPFKITSSQGPTKQVTSGARAGKYIYSVFNEPYYKLVIRVDLNANDVITVLEGDYTKNRRYFTPIQANYDDELEDKNYDNVKINKLMDNLQLLETRLGNNNINYPFADKLIEYLTDMVILPTDIISNNIIDAKYKVYERYGNNYYVDQDTGEKVYPFNHIKNRLGYMNGSFTNIDRLRFLDAYAQTKYEYKKSYDLLGYVDKDIEQCLDDETKDPKINGEV